MQDSDNRESAEHDYLVRLALAAAVTPIGKTWLLDGQALMADLKVSELTFQKLRRQLESIMPGKWDRQASLDALVHIYRRLE